MKNTLFLFVLMLFAASACENDGVESVQEIRPGKGKSKNSAMIRNPRSADLPLDTNLLARISYEESVFEFGEVEEGDIVEHTFNFMNTGNVPLTILNARSSCGCTIPKWPEEPIAPGETGEIHATFNTAGKMLDQNKWITITANTYPNQTKVLLKGKVKPK